MASTVTKTQSNKAPLGDSHNECAADKYAEIMLSCYCAVKGASQTADHPIIREKNTFY